MVSINGKPILEALKEGMEDNGLPWLSRFCYKCDEIPTGNFFNINQTNIVFEIKKTEKLPNAKYLPYCNGIISRVEIGNDEFAISGRFSGCYMGIYWEGNKKYICHIPTGDGIGNQCLESFNKERDERNISFKPSMIIGEKKDKKGVKYYPEITKECNSMGFNFKGVEDVYGIITDDNKLYSFIAAQKGSNYFVMAFATWILKDGKQILRQFCSKYENLYPFLIHF